MNALTKIAAVNDNAADNEVRTIARRDFNGAPLPERYEISLTRDGIVLTCSISERLPADTFYIPTELRDWIATNVAVTPAVRFEDHDGLADRA
jgi:hypothetical protein